MSTRMMAKQQRRGVAVCVLGLLLLAAAAAAQQQQQGSSKQQEHGSKPSDSGKSKDASSSSSSSSSKQQGSSSANKQDGPTSSSSTTSNPLLANILFPQWDRIQASDVEPAVQQVLQEEAASLDLLEADLTAAVASKAVTYERIFRAYTQIRLRLDVTYGMIDHLQGVLDGPPLRKAVEAVQPDRVAFELRFSQSKPIYEAVMALKDDPAKYAALSTEQKRVLDVTVKDFKTSGVGLDPAGRARYNAVVDRLSKLATNFTNNVLDSTAAFKVLITDKRQVEGLEPTTLDVAASKAAAAGHKGATPEAGPWLLTLDYTTYSAVVAFAKDRGVREMLYKAYRSIGANGTSDNTPVINALLAGRREIAALLGFPNYAQQAFMGKMATFKQAEALMAQVAAVARPVAGVEDSVLRAWARNESGDPSLQLAWWDNAFWAERLKERVFDVNQEELRQYLPLESVKAGMFNLAKRLYGVTLRPATTKLPVWHPDVQVYEVLDPTAPTGPDKPSAYMYADFFARPGTKQGGAWVQALADRAPYYRTPSPAALAAAEARAAGRNASGPALYSADLARKQADWLAAAPPQLPIAVLIANQNPPAGGKPSLMTLDDAETLFHEFGHALQAMLTRATEPLSAGIRNIDWDAVEAPSQMQEKWVYDRDTFNGFARHWQTGARVSPEVFERIRASRTYRKGNSLTYQLVLATTDLLLHSTYKPYGPLAPYDVQQAQFGKIMPYKPFPGDRQVNSFSHVFTGGYAAGYYSYLWADVMSADAYMAFEEVGTSSKQAEELGRRFRDTFLALGGSVPPAEVFKRFRGREPRVESLIKFYELRPDTPAKLARAAAADQKERGSKKAAAASSKSAAANKGSS